MNKPMSPAVLARIADHLQRVFNYSIAESVLKATHIVKILQQAGVDVVMPDWVPDDSLASKQPRTFEDLAGEISIDLTDRKPWLPQ